ncbi:MAG: ATP-binding cassette domain-containing protein, partial [Bacteroidota bacterium]|nr:ATP-binding cassette domain-containing protein [Bacteroidota bacterium]
SDVEKIGYLPEERGLYKKMKVGEQALYLARLKGLSRHEALKRLKYWFEKFEIQTWWNKKVMELSKGMQQKVQFICTVLHEPQLLIFDEPFSGFDPINSNMMKDEILELKAKGATIIFSTHDMASVEELCDHIALINKSKKILDGKVDNIRNQYKNNNFEITYEGNYGAISSNLPNEFQIIDHTENHQVNTIKIHHEAGRTNSEMLAALLPYAEITSFREIIPSMNEVFIRVVEEANR